MEWIPIVFVVFKALVLGTGMFFAVKWHYDQGRKGNRQPQEKGALLRASGKVLGLFLLALLVLGLLTMAIVRVVGLNLSN